MADGNIEDEWDTDEEDEEYVPPDGEVSDEDVSDQSDDEHENDNDEDPSLANPGHKRKTKSIKGKKRRRLESKKDASEDEKETKELKPLEVDEKKKMDSLWADFLSDPAVKSITPAKKNASESQDKEAKKPAVETPEEKPKVTPEKPKKVTVTELFHFAGETVEVKKEVDSTSEQAKDAIRISGTSKTTSEVKKPAASGGLGNLLQQIGGKKNKLTVLEKTKIDWNTFKKEEGIEEDLKIHNKGKDGYIDKMEFLQRTDLRQFEIEKRIRSINRTRKS